MFTKLIIMKKVLFILLMATVLVSSCKKEDEQPNDNTNTTSSNISGEFVGYWEGVSIQYTEESGYLTVDNEEIVTSSHVYPEDDFRDVSNFTFDHAYAWDWDILENGVLSFYSFSSSVDYENFDWNWFKTGDELKIYNPNGENPDVPKMGNIHYLTDTDLKLTYDNSDYVSTADSSGIFHFRHEWVTLTFKRK